MDLVSCYRRPTLLLPPGSFQHDRRSLAIVWGLEVRLCGICAHDTRWEVAGKSGSVARFLWKLSADLSITEPPQHIQIPSPQDRPCPPHLFPWSPPRHDVPFLLVHLHPSTAHAQLISTCILTPSTIVFHSSSPFLTCPAGSSAEHRPLRLRSGYETATRLSLLCIPGDEIGYDGPQT